MSTLSDVRLLEKIYDHELKIDPLILDHIQPSSIDLTLSTRFKVPKVMPEEISIYDKIEEVFYEELDVHEYLLEPGAFVIGQINETIGFSRNIHGHIQNRNSLIRMGIDVGLSSYINPGYEGKLPIVIKNIGTFRINLVAGARICQLVVHDVKPESKMAYHEKEDAKYFRETEIGLPKTYLDKEFKEYLNIAKGRTNTTKDISSYLMERIKQGKTINSLTPEEKEKIGL